MTPRPPGAACSTPQPPISLPTASSGPVDGIAADARSNKAQLYAYYESKEGLFEAVLAEQVVVIVHAGPLDGRDLPSHALGLYDAYLARPELVRLATWARLERRPTGDLFSGQQEEEEEEEEESAKLTAIAQAQGEGLADPAMSPLGAFSLAVRCR